MARVLERAGCCKKSEAFGVEDLGKFSNTPRAFPVLIPVTYGIYGLSYISVEFHLYHGAAVIIPTSFYDHLYLFLYLSPSSPSPLPPSNLLKIVTFIPLVI